MKIWDKVKNSLGYVQSMIMGRVMGMAKFTYLEVPFLAVASVINKVAYKKVSNSLSVSRGKKKELVMDFGLKSMSEIRKKPYKEQQSSLLRYLRKDFAKGVEQLPEGEYTSNVNEKIYRAIYASKALRENENIKVEIVDTFKRKIPTEKMVLMSNKELWKEFWEDQSSNKERPKDLLIDEASKTETIKKIVITKKQGINKEVVQKLKSSKEQKNIERRKDEVTKKIENKLELVEKMKKEGIEKKSNEKKLEVEGLSNEGI